MKSLERRLIITSFYHMYTLNRNNRPKIFNQLKLFAGIKVGTLSVCYSFSVEITECWKMIHDFGLKKEKEYCGSI